MNKAPSILKSNHTFQQSSSTRLNGQHIPVPSKTDFSFNSNLLRIDSTKAACSTSCHSLTQPVKVTMWHFDTPLLRSPHCLGKSVSLRDEATYHLCTWCVKETRSTGKWQRQSKRAEVVTRTESRLTQRWRRGLRGCAHLQKLAPLSSSSFSVPGATVSPATSAFAFDHFIWMLESIPCFSFFDTLLFVFMYFWGSV